MKFENDEGMILIILLERGNFERDLGAFTSLLKYKREYHYNSDVLELIW